MVRGTSVFFIQKPPLVVSGKMKSIPSFGAFVRLMSPVARCDGVARSRAGTASRRDGADTSTLGCADRTGAGEGADECEDDDAGRRQSHAPGRGSLQRRRDEDLVGGAVQALGDGDADPAEPRCSRSHRGSTPESSGCSFPAASRARQQSSYSPERRPTGIATHSRPPTERGRRLTRASAHVRPPSIDTSTAVTSDSPGHARPSTAHSCLDGDHGPKSGIPGGSSARGRGSA